jgi:hypothetical protein
MTTQQHRAAYNTAMEAAMVRAYAARPDEDGQGDIDLGTEFWKHISALASLMEHYMTDGRDAGDIEEMCTAQGHQYDATYPTRQFVSHICNWLLNDKYGALCKVQGGIRGAVGAVRRAERDLNNQRDMGTDDDLLKANRYLRNLLEQRAMLEALAAPAQEAHRKITGVDWQQYRAEPVSPVRTAATSEAAELIAAAGVDTDKVKTIG